MWILRYLQFILSLALSCVSGAAAVIHVFGYEGRDVQVSCSYKDGYESYEKYLCRNNCGSGDDVLVTTTQGKNNKYSITDDKKQRIYTTTISDLTSGDAGKYWCGVTRSRIWWDYYPSEVQIHVVPDSCCDRSTTIHGQERDSVSISCVYNSVDQNNLKYFCRGQQPSTCLQQAVVTSDNKHQGRHTLTDDSSKFTVTINRLTQQDFGWYICGVHRNPGLDVFSAVKLVVKVSPQETSTALSIVTSTETVAALETVRSQSTYMPSKPGKDGKHILIVAYSLPAVLVGLLILILLFIWIYRVKCREEQGVTMDNIKSNEEITVNNIYNIKEDPNMASLELQGMPHHDDNPGQDEQPVYQNFTMTEDRDVL